MKSSYATLLSTLYVRDTPCTHMNHIWCSTCTCTSSPIHSTCRYKSSDQLHVIRWC